MSIDSCLLCGRATSLVLGAVGDNRLGVPGTWNIRRCGTCGLEQTAPCPTQAELVALYERYYNYGGERDTAYTRARERFFASGLYRLFLALDGDVSFHAERGSGRLLDVGCNEGRGLALYRANGFTPEGLELNRVAAAAARRRGFVVHELDIAQFSPSVPFERVVLSNVLEHALDPRVMLAHVHRLLRPGGEAWISLPNARSWLRALFGRHWINWHVPFHITHFSRDRLTTLLGETGFEVVAARDITPALWVAQSAIAWAFAGRPGAIAKLRSTSLVGPLMLLARGLLFWLLWLGNRLGRGDCLVLKARRT